MSTSSRSTATVVLAKLEPSSAPPPGTAHPVVVESAAQLHPAVVARDHDTRPRPEHEVGADRAPHTPERASLETHERMLAWRSGWGHRRRSAWGRFPILHRSPGQTGRPRTLHPRSTKHRGGCMFGVLAQEGGPLEVTFGSFENTWLWIVLAVSL